MILLFWNLYRRNNAKHLINIIQENNVDVAIFAEYSETDFQAVEYALPQYGVCHGFGGTDKIILLANKNIRITVRQEQTRYSIYTCEEGSHTFIIAGIHLPANPVANAESRKNVIRDLVSDISSVERELKLSNTIVIGDFNASPFDDELVQKDAFNAVLFKELIMKQERVTANGKKYRRFYNPHISVISEDDKNYGSFYYSSGMNSLYWYCYDQILVRKPLVDLLQGVHYCHHIMGQSLLNDVAPNKTISDHLPLLARIETGGIDK